MPERLPIFICWICSSPIPQQECETDALGYPVHKACYATMLLEEARKRRAATHLKWGRYLARQHSAARTKARNESSQ
jgi:hypothetical protein